jgi:membrane associated rhomboid family serine protease
MDASGAIAGIMGGFMVVLPRHDVRVVLVSPSLAVGSVPAWVCIGIWIVIQVLEASGITRGQPNVGYAAHIAGFLVGCLLVQTYLSAEKYVSTTLTVLFYIFPLVWPELRGLLRNWLEK